MRLPTLAEWVLAIEEDVKAIGRFAPHFLIAYDDHQAVILRGDLLAPLMYYGNDKRNLTQEELAIYEQALVLASGDKR